MNNLAHHILYAKPGSENILGGGHTTFVQSQTLNRKGIFPAGKLRRIFASTRNLWSANPDKNTALPNLPGGRNRLASSSFGALLIYALGAVLSYASQLVIVRVIGAESFGIYSYVLAWVTMLAYLSTLGFHVSLLRFIPAYRAHQRWSLIRGIIGCSQRAAVITGLCVILIGTGIIAVRYGSMQPELALTFVIGLVTVPVISQHLISASFVRSFGGVVRALAPERVVRDSVMLAVVALVALSGFFVADAKLAMAASFISALATLVVLRVFLKLLRPVELISNPPVYAVKEWLKPAIPVMFIVVADSLMSRSGVIVLGFSGNTLDAGIFAVALSMAILTGLPRMAVASAFAPNVSDLHVRGDHAGLQALATKATLLSLVASLGVAIPLLILIRPLLALFDSSFVSAAPVVAVLVFGQVFAAACGPQQHLITMTGNEKSAATLMMACALANLAACVLAIKIFGTLGAAIAMTGTLIVWNIAMAVYIHRRLHLVPGLISAFTAKLNKGW
jgi:O-antigen/teichoic acid export membrane protein